MRCGILREASEKKIGDTHNGHLRSEVIISL